MVAGQYRITDEYFGQTGIAGPAFRDNVTAAFDAAACALMGKSGETVHASTVSRKAEVSGSSRVLSGAGML
jgi:hypothetical protein